jgi:serine/threonine-protein kinase
LLGGFEDDVMSVTLEQFVQHLTQSGLLSAAEISSFQDSLPPEKRPKDGETLARALVQANRLTKYQAQVVYQGKVKGLVFGDYRVLDKLGQGGMGVVLKAEHRRMKRVVAVKMISGAALKSPDAVKRFYREVEAAAKLNHPNIVQAYDAGEHEGGHYLVMEYVEGKDLGAIVKEKGPLPIAQAVNYAVQAARGLQRAHEQGIVHRDIKPANLLVDQRGTVKILDMGLARIAGLADQDDKDRLTASGQVMGTCDYMAPEQALDTHHADQRADIYSLGCTLYRLLTNEVLYQGESLTKILIAHQLSPVPSLCPARGGVSPQLDAVFQKMVAKKPEDRQQSMAEVIAELVACGGKREVTSASVAEEATSVIPRQATGSSPQKPAARPAATSRKNTQVQRLAEATTAHQAVAAETSRQFDGAEKLRPAARKKKTLAIAAGLGLLGVLGAVALVIFVRNGGGDGSETGIQAPQGSEVKVSKDGRGNAPPLAVAPFDATRAKQHQEAWATHLGMPVEETNSVGMKLALIPPGEFEMGSTPTEVAWAMEEGKKQNEKERPYFLAHVPREAPQHHVRITRPFYLGVYPVTQAEYKRVTGVNPSDYTGNQMDVSAFRPPLDAQVIQDRKNAAQQIAGRDTSRHPVEMVDWDEALEFCRKLSAMPAERAAGRVYRLPTEAQWEYACRAGTTTRWYSGNDVKRLGDVAWFGRDACLMTHPVGQKQPNAWGLYDMYGMGQWCFDRVGPRYYAQSPLDDPTGPSRGPSRVKRGSHWPHAPSECRSAFRSDVRPDLHDRCTGFRVVAEVEGKAAAGKGKAEGVTADRTPIPHPQSPIPPPAVAPFDAAGAQQHQATWAKHLGLPVKETNAIGMPLELIPPGEFAMGSTSEEIATESQRAKERNEVQGYLHRVASEGPRHRVKITRPFYLGTYPVTQGEYERLMGVNPSAFATKQMEVSAFKPPLDDEQTNIRARDARRFAGKDTSHRPVETVSWDDCMEFCRRLSALPAERAAGRVYRLPTEAEWEYACRAGTTTRWYCGNNEAGLADVAWVKSFNESTVATHPVGERRPNAWGLCDMHGNVWQWCADWFGENYYQQSPPSDPRGPAVGRSRVSRGGSWFNNASFSRSAYRQTNRSVERHSLLGFRVVAEIEVGPVGPAGR